MQQNCRLTAKLRVLVAHITAIVVSVAEVVETDAAIAVGTLPSTVRASVIAYTRANDSCSFCSDLVA